MESFGQADDARAGVTEGIGLGLPLVKAISGLDPGAAYRSRPARIWSQAIFARTPRPRKGWGTFRAGRG